MTALTWAGVAAMILVAIIGGRFALAGQRQQASTQERVATIQRRSAESRMALDMAIEVRDRLDVLEAWEDDVSDWWEQEHRPRDEIRDRELAEANPEVLHKLPPLTPMPRPSRARKVSP